MKRSTTLLLAGAVAALTVACGDGAGKKADPMKIDNSLTEAEKSAGILTPEVMWKMCWRFDCIARWQDRSLYGELLQHEG